MIKPVSNIRQVTFLNDFQVFKGVCEKTMRPFGQPVSATHEAQLMIRDDQQKSAGTKSALYAIHQRSENKITEIIQPIAIIRRALQPKRTPGLMPLLKAA